MLAAVSQALSGEEINVRSLHMATTEGGLGQADLVIDVAGRDGLNRIVAVLRRIAGVTGVEVRATSDAAPPQQ